MQRPVVESTAGYRGSRDFEVLKGNAVLCTVREQFPVSPEPLGWSRGRIGLSPVAPISRTRAAIDLTGPWRPALAFAERARPSRCKALRRSEAATGGAPW